MGILNKLRSCYKRCIKLLFFGFSLRDSLANILFNLGLLSFDTVTNAAVSYARLWSSCTNSIVMHLRQLSLLSV